MSMIISRNNAGSKHMPVFEAVIGSKVFVSQNIAKLPDKGYHCFETQKVLRYDALCDDFGPMNMSSVFAFIDLLDDEISEFPSLKIVFCVERGRRALANAVFLLGAYLIFKFDATEEELTEKFEWLDEAKVEPFRDATFSESDFDLTLLDCWRGLLRGKANGWVDRPNSEGVWGKIDREEYEQYDNPLNGDLHEIVPGKFVAFKGPKDLGGVEYRDDKCGYRHFSADYYTEIFEALRVKTVVRLNEPEYDARVFTSCGIAHHDMEFEDCTSPPPDVVDAFLRLASSSKGAIAVHCKAGLGRTGTLIAIYMMRCCGFTAREAIGWLRIMRPGSVIGEQQHFLCDYETRMAAAAAAAAAAAGRRSGGEPIVERLARASTSVDMVVPDLRGEAARASFDGRDKAAGGAAAAALAVQVAIGMERRGASRSNSVALARSKSVSLAVAFAPSRAASELPEIRRQQKPLPSLVHS